MGGWHGGRDVSAYDAGRGGDDVGSALASGQSLGLAWVSWGIWGGLGVAVVAGFGLIVFGGRGRG